MFYKKINKLIVFLFSSLFYKDLIASPDALESLTYLALEKWLTRI
jgi:hypothetical protein